MRKTVLLIVAVTVGLCMVAGAYFWAIGMMDSIYAYRSQLKDSPPEPVSLQTEALSGRVIIVLVDGLRLDTSLDKEVMPALNQLRTQGAFSAMHSQAPSYSEPGYSTILTGAWPEVNDGPAFNLDYADIATITQDTIFTVVHRAGLKTAISAYYWFEKLIAQDQVDHSFYTEGDDKRADAGVMEAAFTMIDDSDANLVLIHLDQVDYAGHHEGGVNENWDAAASRCDDYLAQIVNKLDFSTDTLIIFSDHGHIGQGGHGGTELVVRTEPFVMVGAGVTPGEYQMINMVDIAPTIAFLLGADLPSTTQGQVRSEMLNAKAADLAMLNVTTISQQINLVTDYGRIIGKEVNASEIESGKNVHDFQTILQNLRISKLSSERMPRLVIAGAIIAAMVAALIVLWKKEVVWWITGSIVYWLIFNLVYIFGFQKTYTFSTVTGAMGLIISTAIVCAIALIPAWLLVSLLLNQFKKSRMDSSLSTISFASVILCSLLIPVALHFGINGTVLTWTMPQWDFLYMGLLALVQILVVVVLSLILTGISALAGSVTKKKS